MQEQLQPLMEQLNRVKDLPIPEFGTLQAWEARASAAARAANGDSSSNDPSKNSQGLGYGGTPMPFLGETKVMLDRRFSTVVNFRPTTIAFPFLQCGLISCI